MSKSPETQHYLPSFDLELPPGPARVPTWLDRIFSPGDIARIRFETPLDREQGMKLRQQRVKDELEKAHQKLKRDTLTSDGARLERVIEVYTLLTTEEAVKSQMAGIMIASEVGSILYLIKTEFDIELPKYEVFFEED